MFDLWPLWIYALIGVVCFASEPKGHWRTLFISIFPLHPFVCSFCHDFGQMVLSDASKLLSGFPWINCKSIRDIFGGDK
ncbi:MAG: hypothetical protein QM775_25680 [Pirellulales bacterium]